MTNHPSLLPLPEYLTERRSELVDMIYKASGILQKGITDHRLSAEQHERLIDILDELKPTLYDWRCAMRGEASNYIQEDD